MAEITNSEERFNGFGIFDLDTINLNSDTLLPVVKITAAICGINSDIVHSEKTRQIVYLSQMDQITILPLLHQSVIDFEYMKPKSHYLMTKKSKNAFLAVDKNNTMWKWSIETGRLLSQTIIHEDLSHYEVW